MIVLVAGLGLLSPTSAFAVDCTSDHGNNAWDNKAIGTCAAETEAWVRLKLQQAQTILERMISRSPAKYDAKDKAVQDVLFNYLNLNPADYKLWLTVLVDEIKQLRAMKVSLVPPGASGNRCDETPGTHAYTDRENKTIHVCREWSVWKNVCRRQVLMHEYFHLVGHEDFYKRARREHLSSKAVLSKFQDAGFVAMAVIALTKEKPLLEIAPAETCQDDNAVNLHD
jgi:hypothetical protein